jgi:hypothetical protein
MGSMLHIQVGLLNRPEVCPPPCALEEQYIWGVMHISYPSTGGQYGTHNQVVGSLKGWGVLWQGEGWCLAVQGCVQGCVEQLLESWQKRGIRGEHRTSRGLQRTVECGARVMVVL